MSLNNDETAEVNNAVSPSRVEEGESYETTLLTSANCDKRWIYKTLQSKKRENF